MEERERERVQAAPGGRPSPSAAQARRLVALARERGAEAVPALRAFLRHRDPWVRLHAVQGLATIDDADARAGLIGALHDDNFGVHQAAARALAGAGRTATVAVLEALVRDQPSTGFLHGAAHVLKHARLTPEDRAAVAPVVDAFRQTAVPEPASSMVAGLLLQGWVLRRRRARLLA